VGSPGTCHYGVFDGVDDYIEVEDRDSLDNTSQITLSAWFKADSFTQTNGSNARGILSKRPDFSSNMSYGIFFLNGQGGKLYIDIVTQNDRFATQKVFNTDQWYHLAVVFDGTLPQSERVSVYVDGVLEGKYSESSTFIPNTNSNFYIGNLYTGTNILKVFDGAIDEVNVIPFAYSQSQINKLMRKARPCVAGIDHIEIVHTGNGVSCAAHSVNLRACANSDCSTLYTGSDIEFTLKKEEAGNLTDIGVYTISGATGVLNNATFNETTVGSFNLTGESSISSDIQCVNTSTGDNSCNYNVSSSGFVVSSGNNSTAQSCGTNSFTIQAVKSPDSRVGGACVPAYSNGNFPLTFSYNYVNPDVNSVLNKASANIQGQDHIASQVGSPVSVPFDNNAQAQIDVNYAEAGQISIQVNDADGVLSSTSATLAYIPAKLTAQWADGDPNNLAAIDEQVIISGQCADGTVLQNYTPSGEYLVEANRSMPSDAEILSVAPTLTPNDLENLILANSTYVKPNSGPTPVDVSSSANTAIVDLNYDESARLQLTFSDVNYFGQTIGMDSNLEGTFTISYYSASVNTPSVIGACNASNYIGQEFGWDISPNVTLTAKNAINETTQFADVLNYWTQNITNISTEMVSNTYLDNNVNPNNVITTNNGALSVSEIDTDKVDGMRTYSVLNQKLQYRKTSEPGVPFDSDINLTIPASAFIDSFGIGIKTVNTDTSFQAVNIDNIQGTEQKYARIKVNSALGSEIQDLPWRAELQVFSAAGVWQRNDLDNCTVFTQDAITIDGLNEFDVVNNPPRYTLNSSSGTTELVGFENKSLVTAENGFIVLPFKRPGSLNVGSIEIGVSLENENSFLSWDWDADRTGSFVDIDGDGIDDSLDLNLPITQVAFGRLRGNDRIIYKRER
ncbi:LamG domain-containing protein, partial [Psychrosphaera sp.]|nr:LamG domain-containing protein [Psychrosphaera sp.]